MSDATSGATDSAPPASATPQLDITKLPAAPPTAAAAIKRAAWSAAVAVPTVAALAVTEFAAKPGKERWPVKTGNDDDVSLVGANRLAGANQAGIVDSTVEELIQLPRPADMSDIHGFQEDYQERRAVPVELVIWRVQATITAIKKEADGDLHIVLQGDSGETMIAEAPSTTKRFIGDSPFADAMKASRRAIAEQFGPQFASASFQAIDAKFVMPVAPSGPALAAAPPMSLADAVARFEALQPFKSRVDPTPATVTGVGFFDRVHGQMGVALKNGIELHPILAIEFTGG